MKILLISGHGAGDSGAVGNGYKEADLTRELTKLIKGHLDLYADVDIYDQTRNAYRDVLNGVFNIGKYDYVLEIHFNAFNISAHGTECFVVPDEKGISVEQAIMRRMGKYFKLRDNDNIVDGVKRKRFTVINTVKKRGMSGALLETCFIDNKDNMNTYQNNKNAIAKDISEGIAEGFGLIKQNSAGSAENNAENTAVKLKYKVGDEVTVSSYYTSSTDDVSKAIHKTATGTITKVLTNGARNPYLLNDGGIGWCNDGDIRGFANQTTNTKVLSVGSKVKIKSTAKKYCSGQTIPSSVKKKTYTVKQIGTTTYKDGILLKEILSWVKRSDLEIL